MTASDRFSGAMNRIDKRRKHEKEIQKLANKHLLDTFGTPLRSPRTKAEKALFRAFKVAKTSDGVWFSAVHPLPADLVPFAFFQQSDSGDLLLRQWRELNAKSSERPAR